MISKVVSRIDFLESVRFMETCVFKARNWGHRERKREREKRKRERESKVGFYIM